jgi:hypothetical protein
MLEHEVACACMNILIDTITCDDSLMRALSITATVYESPTSNAVDASLDFQFCIVSARRIQLQVESFWKVNASASVVITKLDRPAAQVSLVSFRMLLKTIIKGFPFPSTKHADNITSTQVDTSMNAYYKNCHIHDHRAKQHTFSVT